MLPASLTAIVEMVRADLEYHWRIGQPKPLADYRRRFPDVFGDPAAAQLLIAEEVRLRRHAATPPTPPLVRGGEGGGPAPSDHPGPFGPLPVNWLRRFSAWDLGSSAEQSSAPPEQPSPGELEFPKTLLVPEGAAGSGADDAGQRVSLKFSPPLSDLEQDMPKSGDDFLGFRLVAALGRGAFGHVFLAHQGELANRPVVLKVSADLFQESQTLAQLHHPHVMPIYSLHQSGRLQAVCMPYFGSTTLADMLKDLKSSQCLPASGKALVETLHQRKSVTRDLSPSRASAPAAAADAAAPAAPAPLAKDKIVANLDKLAKCNYVEAVLWLGAQLADGLGHAHERGILHRDLKPANILVTEEGQAMLLDFNLSVDTKVGSPVTAARMGGTLPYMSPEQLRLFRGERCLVDARSDLFSLGVILFEMLTEHHPYHTHLGHVFAAVPRLIEDRLQLPPDPRTFNRMISPAVASILRQCLQPEPARRYQTAHQLKEDLERHLAHRPLRHAPEPSLRERAAKWTRRHARLAMAGAVACAVSLLILAPTAYCWTREQTLTRLARATRDEFRAEFKAVQGLLNAQDPPRRHLEDGIRRGRACLERFQVEDHPDWRSLPAVRCLAPDDQARLDEDIEELLLLLARATALRAERESAAERGASLQAALTLNELAEANGRAAAPPRALWLQRAQLTRQLGRHQEAETHAQKAGASPLRSVRDYYMTATEHMAQRRFRDALPLLHQATHKDPQYFWAWFAQGMCHYELGEDAKALACYNACIALWPDSHDFHFYRGLVYHRQNRCALAQADFDKAIRLRPDWADAWLNRGVTQGKLGKHREAIDDLTKAQELGTAPTRVLLLRALARERAGDPQGARRDREEGLRDEPTDEVGWIARGLARLPKQPKDALADFEQALALNPRSFAALQNKAHVLADHLDKQDEASAILNRLVESYPDAVLCRLGRGIVRARLGDHEKARDDAKECLARDDSAATYYHVANIYALSSAERKEDEAKALAFLAKAFQGGYGANMAARDPDFRTLRDNAEFQRLLAAAETLGATANRKNQP